MLLAACLNIHDVAALQQRAAAQLGAEQRARQAAEIEAQRLRFNAEVAASSRRPTPDDVITAVPSEFLCPITQAIMNDPVQLHDGGTFDRRAIADWFEHGNVTNPLTSKRLPDRTLTPNYVLRAAIDEWLLSRTASAEARQFRLALNEVEVFESQPLGRGQSKAAFRGRWRGLPVAVLRMAKDDLRRRARALRPSWPFAQRRQVLRNHGRRQKRAARLGACSPRLA